MEYWRWRWRKQPHPCSPLTENAARRCSLPAAVPVGVICVARISNLGRQLARAFDIYILFHRHRLGIDARHDLDQVAVYIAGGADTVQRSCDGVVITAALRHNHRVRRFPADPAPGCAQGIRRGVQLLGRQRGVAAAPAGQRTAVASQRGLPSNGVAPNWLDPFNFTLNSPPLTVLVSVWVTPSCVPRLCAFHSPN